MASHDAPENQQQYLTFFLADEQYAVGVLNVKEIIEYGVVTRVPTTPPYIRGVINLRGSVVPVVDLSVKFGLQECPVSRRTCIIIMETTLRGERATMGVVADSVSQVIQFAEQDIEPRRRLAAACGSNTSRAWRRWARSSCSSST
jgi:purine-binding chemotaxis protein CheW